MTVIPLEVLLNTSLTGDQDQATITALENGKFLVTYRSSDTDTDILGKIYDIDGSLLKDDFTIHTVNTGDQGGAALAAYSAGDAFASFGG